MGKTAGRTSREWVGLAIEVLLGALFLFLPAALGGVLAWSEAVALGVVTILVVLAGVWASMGASRAGAQRGMSRWVPWRVVLPMVGFIGVVGFQLISLPSGMMQRVSPATAQIRGDLMTDLAGVPSLSPGNTISFYPFATHHDLRIVLLAVGIFYVVVTVYRTSGQIKRLLATIACIGAASAVLALLQDFAGNDKIYWVIPTAYRATCGSFVNYSNFSQFMNLSIGAALALLLVRVDEVRATNGDDGEDPYDGGIIARLRDRKYRPVLLLALMIVLSALAIMLSMSRGGMLALIVSALTTMMLVARKRAKEGGWIISAILLVVFSALLYAGFDAVCDRLATLYNRPDPSSGRFQTYKDVAGIIRKFPVLGIGLGSHEMVYPIFDQSHDGGLPQSSDSDWFQVVEETGIAGGVMVVGFVVAIGTYFVRLVRRSRKGIYVAVYGVGFGLIAVVLHSFTDFGQHIPAVAVLSATSCAIVVCLVRLRDEERTSKTASAASPTGAAIGFFPSLAGFATALVVAGGAFWAAAGSFKTAIAEGYWARAQEVADRIDRQDWQGSDDDYRELLQLTSLAAAKAPDNVKYRFELNGRRWHSITRQTAAANSNTPIELTPQQLEFAQRIVDDLQVTRTLCPTFAPPYSLEGQLEFYVLSQADGADRIRQASFLYPNHARIAFETGVADLYQQQWDESLKWFGHSLDLNPGFFGEIADLYIDLSGRPDLAVSLAKQRADVGGLLDLVSRLSQKPLDKQTDAVKTALAEASDALLHENFPDTTPAWQLRAMTELCVQRGDRPQGVDFLRRAISKDYGEAGWHYRLAQLYDSDGKTMDAVDELRVCMRLEPGNGAARQMLGEMSVRPGFIPGN